MRSIGANWPRRVAVARAALIVAAASIAALLFLPEVHAQGGSAASRIGYLSPDALSLGGQEPFLRELSRLGYVEGKDFTLELRSAHGRFERLPALAAELVDLKVDVLVTIVTQASIAAKKATHSIPIVMVGVSDPVGAGLVANLARPGGNVTGTSAPAAELVGKQLELLSETLPAVSRVAALWNPANAVFQTQQLAQARVAAARLRMQLQVVEAPGVEALERAFTAIVDQRAQALLVMADPVFVSNAERIASLASRYRVPAFSGAKVFADAGALLTYGPDYADEQRRAAGYVARILKGAKPADLAVEQSSKFELVVNARTARNLGITVPRPVVLRADRVID